MQTFSLAGVRALANGPDTMPSPTFELRPLGTHVAVVSDREALYMMRYAELSGGPPAEGVLPYLGLESGVVVRRATGWRILRQQNATDSAGASPRALTVAGKWECRCTSQQVCPADGPTVQHVSGCPRQEELISAEEATTGAERTPQEVQALLRAFFGAVERRDLPQFLDLFTGDEHLTVIENADRYDWAAFRGFAEQFFAAIATISFELEHCAVHAIATEVATATGVFRGTGTATSGEPLDFRHAFTFVLAHREGRWRIAHVHESSL